MVTRTKKKERKKVKALVSHLTVVCGLKREMEKCLVFGKLVELVHHFWISRQFHFENRNSFGCRCFQR
jgi:hypothetical protein